MSCPHEGHDINQLTDGESIDCFQCLTKFLCLGMTDPNAYIFLPDKIDGEAFADAVSCVKCQKTVWWRGMYSLQVDPKTKEPIRTLSLKNELYEQEINDIGTARKLFNETAHCIDCIQKIHKERDEKVLEEE